MYGHFSTHDNGLGLGDMVLDDAVSHLVVYDIWVGYGRISNAAHILVVHVIFSAAFGKNSGPLCV
jgi:hypothetical protein